MIRHSILFVPAVFEWQQIHHGKSEKENYCKTKIAYKQTFHHCLCICLVRKNSTFENFLTKYSSKIYYCLRNLKSVTLSLSHSFKGRAINACFQKTFLFKCFVVKVSKSQKQIMVSSILPKNEQNSLSWVKKKLRILSFVRFLGELRTPYIAFEIYWSLWTAIKFRRLLEHNDVKV